MNLEDIGWNSVFKLHFEKLEQADLTPARVVRQDRHRYLMFSEAGEVMAEVSGRMRHEIKRTTEFPVVGDWVALERTSEWVRIEAVLPRKSAISRQMASGGGREQILAANLDTVFLVSGLDGDHNPRRIERFVNLGWESGATPVLILNKADLSVDVEAVVRRVEELAPGVAIHTLSAKERIGLDALETYLTRGRTAALLGSSGVGKSTIVNCLLGTDRQEVFAVREDDSRGRHTTVRRELFVLPSGGAIIDTPGLREVRLWGEEETLATTFADIGKLGIDCRFGDCRHDAEPGCEVLAALERGDLDPGRYENYRKMQKELEHVASLEVPHELRARDRRFSKMVRNVIREKKKD